MRGTRAANSELQPMPILHVLLFPGHSVLPLEPLARLMGARIQQPRAEFGDLQGFCGVGLTGE